MTQVIPFADPAILSAYRAFERAIYEELAGAKAAQQAVEEVGALAPKQNHKSDSSSHRLLDMQGPVAWEASASTPLAVEWRTRSHKARQRSRPRP